MLDSAWVEHSFMDGLNSIYKLSLIQIFHSISRISQIFFHMFSLTGTDARIGCNDFCFLWALLETILLILLCILLVGASRSCSRKELSLVGKLYVTESLICFCIYLFITLELVLISTL